MAKKPKNTENLEAQAQPPVKMKVLAQYVRDMSFENIVAQKGISGDMAPEISVQVNLDAKKRPFDNQYEVIIKTDIASKTKEKGEKKPLWLLPLETFFFFVVVFFPLFYSLLHISWFPLVLPYPPSLHDGCPRKPRRPPHPRLPHRHRTDPLRHHGALR